MSCCLCRQRQFVNAAQLLLELVVRYAGYVWICQLRPCVALVCVSEMRMRADGMLCVGTCQYASDNDMRVARCWICGTARQLAHAICYAQLT